MPQPKKNKRHEPLIPNCH